MPLTKEQLLIPRVMCVGGKEGEPNDTSGKYISGDVLTQFVNNKHLYASSMGNGCVSFLDFYLDRFPHLFLPMPWWEHRKPEDMPLYLKSIGSKRVLEVKEYSIENGVFLSHIGTDPYESLNYFEPATEQEYLEYLKQKEG